MYKNLNSASLGISGRLNELIELALTYRFSGFDLELETLAQQAETRGVEHATRFLSGAQIKIGGFDLDLDLITEDQAFEADIKRLPARAEVARAVSAHTAILTVSPYCAWRQYHETFQLHCDRIGQIADTLGVYDINLALNFLAPAHHREDNGAQFIATPDALLTLIKMIGMTQVGLCLDTWHWYVAGGTATQIEGFPANQIYAVRLADLPQACELNTITEQDRLLPGETDTVPNVLWMQWLESQGYTGPVTAYSNPAQFSGTTRAQAAEQASQSLDRLLESCGENPAASSAEPTSLGSNR